ncbi:MAG: FkbM family methyltransferase [Verrucomicrobiota bacterium]
MLSAQNIVRACLPRRVRNWLRSPARSARWLCDEIQHTAGLDRTITIRPGWPLRCHPAAYRCAYSAQHIDPEQVAEFDSFISTCQPGMVLFDAGAHFGLFSLAALHYGGSSAKVIAVDPSPTACRMMRIQARLNGVEPRLHVVQASVGDCEGWQKMLAVGVLAGGYFVPATGGYPEAELTRTEALTLDRLAAKFNITPTHVKIDVEGGEAAVLRGGKNILAPANAPLLFVEMHNQIVRQRNADPSETLSLLRGFRYCLFNVDGTPVIEEKLLKSDLARIVARKISE